MDNMRQFLKIYGEGGSYKKKFGVSTQHYSFAVKAFVDMAERIRYVSKYEFAIRETKDSGSDSGCKYHEEQR